MVRVIHTRVLAAALVAAVSIGATSLAGCGAAAPDTSARAQIRFEITPDSARVYTEDRFIGSARVLSARPPSFRTGARQITITADGYFPVDLDLELEAGTTNVRVAMRPVPP